MCLRVLFFFLIGAMFVWGPVPAKATTTVTANEVPSVVLAEGALPGPADFAVETARSETEWRDLARRVGVDAVVSPDFTHEMVVAVFLGTRPTGGHAVRFADIRDRGFYIEATFEEIKPAADTMTMQMLTNPYVVVKIPTRAKPVGVSRTPFGAVTLAPAELAVLSQMVSRLRFEWERAWGQAEYYRARLDALQRQIDQIRRLLPPGPPLAAPGSR